MSKVKIFTGIMVLFLLGVATGSLMTNIYLKTDFGVWGKGNSIDKRDFLIKRFSVSEHRAHAGDLRSLPSRNISVERLTATE